MGTVKIYDRSWLHGELYAIRPGPGAGRYRGRDDRPGPQHEGALICPLYYTGLADKNRDTTRPWLLGRRREAN
jgi:hypothetical protein